MLSTPGPLNKECESCAWFMRSCPGVPVEEPCPTLLSAVEELEVDPGCTSCLHFFRQNCPGVMPGKHCILDSISNGGI